MFADRNDEMVGRRDPYASLMVLTEVVGFAIFALMNKILFFLKNFDEIFLFSSDFDNSFVVEYSLRFPVVVLYTYYYSMVHHNLINVIIFYLVMLLLLVMDLEYLNLHSLQVLGVFEYLVMFVDDKVELMVVQNVLNQHIQFLMKV
jgi:hypothetical protein